MPNNGNTAAEESISLDSIQVSASHTHTHTHPHACHSTNAETDTNAEKRFRGEERTSGLPPKLLRAKLLAAKELAAYTGYASTRKVKIPLKTRIVLRFNGA